jgi:pyrroline-5-carboxylate reductase
MKIGFLGSGKMAEAILAGVLDARLARPGEIVACEKLAERRAEMRKRYKVRVTASASETLAACDTIVLSVKPQDLDAMLAPLAPHWTSRHLVVSIAAGKTLAGLQPQLGARVRLVRVMPNLAVMVGEGMSAFCLGAAARAADRRTVQRILGCAGRAIELAECHFDAVTALSGSGPAFFAYVMQAMADAAAGAGLPAEAARLLAEQTMLGAARYLLETGRAPQDFIQAVASPKGTTAAGLAVLDKSAIRTILGRTIRAAARRSAELSRA